MPFRTLAPTGFEDYLETMPRPLVVAILDGAEEKEGRTTAIVTQGFAYTHPASEAEIIVPDGYVTDFASIPALARAVFPPFGRHAKAAVLHDWLYLVGEERKRDYADRVFIDAMAELGVSWTRRSFMYRSVRMAGETAYGREHKGWGSSFGDWKTGERAAHQLPRETYYQERWLKKPKPGYVP